MYNFPLILKRDNIFISILGEVGDKKDNRLYIKNDPYIDKHGNIILYKKYRMLDIQLSIKIDNTVYVPGTFNFVSGGGISIQLHTNPLNVSHFYVYDESSIDNIDANNVSNTISKLRENILSKQSTDISTFGYTPEDNAFCKTIKAIIMKKNISIKAIRDRSEFSYQISNLKFSLLHDTIMTNKTFIKWCEVLRCDFDISLCGDGKECTYDSRYLYKSKLMEQEFTFSNAMYKSSDFFRFIILPIVNMDTLDTLVLSNDVDIRKKIINIIKQDMPISLKGIIIICDFTNFKFRIHIYDTNTRELIITYDSVENIILDP